MGEETAVETKESVITPEGRVLLDMIRHPFVAERPNEGHYKIMRAILVNHPEVLDKITDTLNQEGLPANEARYYGILDRLYGVSTGQSMIQKEAGKLEESHVSRERIRQLRDKGLRHLSNRIMLETDEGPVSLNQIKQELALKLPLPLPR